MKDIKKIQQALAQAGPGTTVMIRGYVNSDGDRRDLEIELLDAGAYTRLPGEDLAILREATNITTDENVGDLTMTDIITARGQLIASREASMSKRDAKLGGGGTGPDYVPLGPSIAMNPEQPEALYIRGVKITNDELPPAKPAKGAIPRAKQWLAARLNLPSLRYVHNVKLAPGKFEDVQIFEAAENVPLD